MSETRRITINATSEFGAWLEAYRARHGCPSLAAALMQLAHERAQQLDPHVPPAQHQWGGPRRRQEAPDV